MRNSSNLQELQPKFEIKYNRHNIQFKMHNKAKKNQFAQNQNNKQVKEGTNSSLKFKFDDRYTRYIGKRSGKYIGQLHPQNKNNLMNGYSDFITYGSEQFTQNVEKYQNIIINCNTIGKVNFTNEQSQQQQIKRRTQEKVNQRQRQKQQQKPKAQNQQFKTVIKPKATNNQQKQRQQPQISGLPSRFSQQSYKNPFFNLVISSIKKSQPYNVSQQKSEFQDMVKMLSQSQNRVNLQSNFQQLQQKLQDQNKVQQVDKRKDNNPVEYKNGAQKYQNKYKFTKQPDVRENNNNQLSPQHKNKKRVTINSIKSVRVTLSNNKYQDFVLPEQFRQEARKKYQQEQRQMQQRVVQQQSKQGLSKQSNKNKTNIQRKNSEQQLQAKINNCSKMAQEEAVNEDGKRQRPVQVDKKKQNKKTPNKKDKRKKDNKKKGKISLQKQKQKNKIHKDQAPPKVKKVHLQSQKQPKDKSGGQQISKSSQKQNFNQSKNNKQEKNKNQYIKETIVGQGKKLKKNSPIKVKNSPKKHVSLNQQQIQEQQQCFPKHQQNQQQQKKQTEPKETQRRVNQAQDEQKTSNRIKQKDKKYQRVQRRQQQKQITNNEGNKQQQQPERHSKRVSRPVAKFWLGEKYEYKCGQVKGFKAASYKYEVVDQLYLVDKDKFQCVKTFVQNNKVIQRLKLYPQEKAVFKGFESDDYQHLQIKYKPHSVQDNYIKKLQIIILGFKTDFSEYEVKVQKRMPFTIKNKNTGTLPLTISLQLKLK